MKVVFVILHYCAIDTTKEAIEKIRENISYNNYEIVVVDNNSPDGSGKQLQDAYENIEGTYVILNNENVGFAKGNNIGYLYAKNQLQADYIIIMNNDVIIEQKDFVQKILDIYKNEKYHVLGPDICNLIGEHQNPHRQKNFDKEDLKRIIRNRTIIILYLRVKALWRGFENVQIIENWDKKRVLSEKKQLNTVEKQNDVVLHGSCIIFSKDYIEKEENAFYPETFMWMEEEILTYLCHKKGYVITYNPSVKVIHKEGISTQEVGNEREKYLFYSQNLRKSARIMKQLMED